MRREPDRQRMPDDPDIPIETTPLASDDDVASIERQPFQALDRSLVLATIASLVLHAAFVALAYSVRVPEVRIDIDVRESRAVALLSEAGFAPPQPDDGSGDEEFVEVPDEPAPEPEPSADGSGAPDDSPPDESPSEVPTPDATEVPEPSELPAEAVVVAPPDIRRPLPSSERPRPAPRPREGSAEGSGDAVATPDPSSLPPSRRYPEGTLNPVATDVGMWGPEGAASVAIIRADRIRDSQHRTALEGILSGLGDYSDLTRNTSISILDDVDAMLLASTDVTSSAKTFIAAVHRLNPTYLMAELRRGYPSGVNWVEQDGRFWGTPGAHDALPRRFLIPTEQLLIYSPQEFLEPLVGDAPSPRGLEGAIDGIEQRLERPDDLEAILVELGLPAERPQPYVTDGDPCEDRAGVGRTRCRERVREDRERAEAAVAAYEARRAELLPAAEAELARQLEEWDSARRSRHRNRADREPPIRSDESWIGGLLEVGDLAGPGDDGPAVLWSFNGFTSFGLGGLRPGTAPPRALHTSLTLEDDPVLRARFVFESREQAEDFRDQWDAVVEFYTFPLTAAGLLRAFRDGDWEIDHDEAVVTIVAPASSMSRLALAMSMLGGG